MFELLLSQINWVHGLFFILGITLSSPFLFYRLGQQKIHLKQLQTELNDLTQSYQEQQNLSNQLQNEKMQIHGQVQQYQARLNERQLQTQHFQKLWQQSEQKLHEQQCAHNEVMIELAELKSASEQKQLALESQLSHFEKSKLQLKQEFENLANQIFEEKSEKFNTQSQERIGQLLQPVQGELKGFRDKMETIHSEELKQRAALKSELLHLQANNKLITEQADKLTNALQGQKKTQGNWGELMLENVLDSAGLRMGQDYKREASFTTETGTFRPDVLVYLPQQRHLIIDAKTSLNAYTRFVNAESDTEASSFLALHCQAVAERIKELGEKRYEKLPGINSPEVVILFIPVESAFVAAIKHNPTLYQQALEYNILLATPTTLLTSLNIVKQLWRFEEQSKHSRELALRAERFYNKLNGFLHSMESIGIQLDKAKEGYEKAFSQLYSGKGNLIKQASEFKELGVSVSKELPEQLQEKAKLELD